MRLIACLLLLALIVLPCASARAEIFVTGRRGGVSAMRYGAEYLDVSVSIKVPRPGWPRSYGLGDARDIESAASGDRRVWTGQVRVAENQTFDVEQAIREHDGAATFSAAVTARDTLDVEGVFLFTDVPIATFAGGTCTLLAGGEPVATAAMPVEQPEARHFISGQADALRMVSADGGMQLDMALDRPRRVTVQDTREWNGTSYSAYIVLHSGNLPAGRSASISATYSLQGTQDTAPAAVRVDPAQEVFALDGFGGNYCFNIDTPVTQFTLENLDSRWARTEMKPPEWEPENDNADPARTDWDKLRAMDTPDSMLRKRMLLCRELQRRGIPYVISIWHLPQWLYADPGRGPQAHGRKVPREKWPELAECLGSYLVYARDQYGVEPDLFSFNEIDYGVRVKFSPEEHRDFIKFLGPHFASLGLKTRMLLADVANCRGTHVFCRPTLDDPEAMRYVGAVAFHSWGGATAEQYGAWRDLARGAGLPLLVTELGVDANWREVPLDTYRYAMREVEHYQHLIRHAQPQGTMQWEFTADYSLGNIDWDTRTVTPKKRFWFVKHFCNLTPTPGVGIATESDNDHVRVNGFRSPDGGQWTLHISNVGAARLCTITGLPPAIAEWRAILTDGTRSFADQPPVRSSAGSVRVELPANSLLTLTAGGQ